jgi:hypothetical protein
MNVESPTLRGQGGRPCPALDSRQAAARARREAEADGRLRVVHRPDGGVHASIRLDDGEIIAADCRTAKVVDVAAALDPAIALYLEHEARRLARARRGYAQRDRRAGVVRVRGRR